MWNKLFKSFWILNLLYLVHQHVFADGMNCGVLLDGSDKWEAAYEQCIQTNNVEDERGFEDFSLNMTLEEFKTFDDNVSCIANEFFFLKLKCIICMHPDTKIVCFFGRSVLFNAYTQRLKL